MKLSLTIASLVIAAASLAACNTTGPYASASNPSMAWTSYPSGYQTLNNPHGGTCGPDWHVCHYENRDRLARGQQ